MRIRKAKRAESTERLAQKKRPAEDAAEQAAAAEQVAEAFRHFLDADAEDPSVCDDQDDSLPADEELLAGAGDPHLRDTWY